MNKAQIIEQNLPYCADQAYVDKTLLRVDKSHSIQTKIIAAFACLGKTYFADNNSDIALDLESLSFRYRIDDGYDSEIMKCDEKLLSNPDFPENYVDKIIDNYGKYEYIFIALSIPTLKVLDSLRIPY
ncbi:MAG: hypothetical protein LBM09_00315, partial [Candidatus Nomurabacteria bacterium]|nr:hypothetical protein [Candidatus Nomurabacteria bacterium]